MDPAASRPDAGAAPAADHDQRSSGRERLPAPDRVPAAGSGAPPAAGPPGGPGHRGRGSRDSGRRGQATGGDRPSAADRSSAEPREERKRRREGGREGHDRRSYSGFEDGLERAFCIAFRVLPPPAFPVQSRLGIATRRVIQVARRSDALLFCDGAHPGPHLWPDGEEVGFNRSDQSATAVERDNAIEFGTPARAADIAADADLDDLNEADGEPPDELS
jgi:hypothetical protein